MKPVSFPNHPPLPNKPTYNPDDLALFPVFTTRVKYHATFGEEPPPYDPARLIKTWFDSTHESAEPGEVAVYKTIDSTGKVRQFVIPAQEAATVNLPPSAWYRYPAYIIPATEAKRYGPGNLTPQPINPVVLSIYKDAVALAAELGGGQVVREAEMGGGFSTVYPDSEPRRMWDILFKGARQNAGMLLNTRHANGYNAPGRWDLTGESPAWIQQAPPPLPEEDTRKPRPLPLRDLKPQEQIRVTLMGVQIVRTDLIQTPLTTGGGAFTDNDRALLRAIYDKVAGAD